MEGICFLLRWKKFFRSNPRGLFHSDGKVFSFFTIFCFFHNDSTTEYFNRDCRVLFFPQQWKGFYFPLRWKKFFRSNPRGLFHSDGKVWFFTMTIQPSILTGIVGFCFFHSNGKAFAVMERLCSFFVFFSDTTL